MSQPLIPVKPPTTPAGRTAEVVSPASTNGLRVRAAEAAERSSALRLLLSTPEGYPDDEQVVDFMRYALSRDLGLQNIKVCVDESRSFGQAPRLLSAALPIVSPGRSALIMTPGADVQDSRSAEGLAMLLREVRSDLRARDVRIGQVMVDPQAGNLERVFEAVGMTRLAEILFMQRHLRGTVTAPVLPAGSRWASYSASTHHLFAATIEKTYEKSLDCPALSSLRTVEDVIMGHKGTGDHDDKLWLLLMEREEPSGVVLLTRHTRESALELVYLGSVPSARGRGIGHLLTRQCLHLASSAGCAALHLAVDAGNVSAMRVYRKNGLAEVHRRVAWIFDLTERNSSSGNTLAARP